MPQALQIETDGSVETVALPDDRTTRDQSLKARLSGTPDPGYYHRRATMWGHDNGQREQFQGHLVATALACAWRGLDITYDATYFLPGRVVVTCNKADLDLAPDLIEEVHAVAAAIRKLLNGGAPVAWGDIVAVSGIARQQAG